MKINVQIDTTNLYRRMRNGERRYAYAVVNAINNIAKAVQQAVVAHVMGGAFTVRKAEFIRRQAAIIKPFASVREARPFAIISVGKKDRLLLSRFERGGRRPVFVGRRAAVPVYGGPARPSFGVSVPKEFTVKGLRLKRSKKKGARRRKTDATFAAHTTSTGKVQLKGQHRTFVLFETNKAPEGGIFQRVGPGRDDIRMAYSFVGGQQLKARLGFLQTAREISDRTFKENMERETINAIARSGGLSA